MQTNIHSIKLATSELMIYQDSQSQEQEVPLQKMFLIALTRNIFFNVLFCMPSLSNGKNKANYTPQIIILTLLNVEIISSSASNTKN